jgi:hypothetical protein
MKFNSSTVQFIQEFNWFKEGSNVQCPENNVIYKNPNFYTELCCEVSGDAAQ